MSNTAIEMNGLLDCEFFDIKSECVNDTFRIFVAKPPHVEGGKYPAIFTTDGNGTFPLVASIQRLLAWGAEAPAAYVVGIGYPTEGGYGAAIAKRNRDYVPTLGTNTEYARAILGITMTAGAAAFLQFIREELQPDLQKRYAIDQHDATYFGSSLGGLFGAWTLLTAPSTFQRYILASPTISWNDEEVWAWEQAYAASRNDLGATVFVSAGELESPEEARKNAVHIGANNSLLRPRVEASIAWFDAHGWPRTTALAPEFAAKLRSRGYPSLKICSHNMPDENHMSVPPAVVSRGLRFMFDHWKP